MKKILLLLIALAASVAAWAWDGSGTQSAPYLIKTTDDLVTLSTNSASNGYNGTYFRLENDLDMAGVSIEPIGISRSFRGVFDGNGHVISNLTISKPDDNTVALFGNVRTGFSVKSLILDGAIIAGNYDVGALVGYFSFGCNIENCLVVNSHVTANGRAGIIIGSWDNNATLSSNYYRNCSVSKGDNTSTTNIGVGVDREGAVLSNASITMPAGVRVISGGVAYNGTVYTASGATVTFSSDEELPVGCSYTYTPDGGTAMACTVNGDGTFSFTMPAEGDVTVGIASVVATWATVSDLFANASTDADNPTEVVLGADITADEDDTYITLSGGRHVILDLNGHTLDRHLTEAKTDGSGYVIRVNGRTTSLTIRDSGSGGTITGGWNKYGAGCIAVSGNSTLRLEGGIISGNRVSQNGGAISLAGNFYMTGGAITGNAANLVGNNIIYCGGALYFSDSSHFYMSGGSITGNYCGTTDSGAAGIGCYAGMGSNHVHLSGTYDISGNQQGAYDEATDTWSDLSPSDILNHERIFYDIDGAISPVAPASMIIDAHYNKNTFTSGWATYMSGIDPETCFTLLPYVTDCGIGVVDGEATIGTLHTITLGENITASATSAAPGRPITLGYTKLPDGYQVYYYTVTIDGSDPVETVAVTDGTFAMPDGDVTVAATLSLPIDEAHFPDANFRDWLLSQDYGSDGVLTDEEVADITSLDVTDKSISDLTGIEYFTALTFLSCGSNQLQALDVSHNTALTLLDCFDNQLTVLDVSHNTALTRIDCCGNQLTSLDVSRSTALAFLGCFDNQLQALDVSHNTALTVLYCYDNRIYGENMAALVASLPTVDVENNYSQNGDFYVINLDSDTEQNVITTTQVATARGKNWTVYGLTNYQWQEYDGSAEGLPIIAANFPDANFRDWLLSQSYGSDGVLTDEEIAGITVLNLDNKSISDLTGIEHFTALAGLSCANNQLTTLDVSHNTALTDLFCNNNQLTALDVRQNSELRLLRCYDNQLTALDVTGCTELKQLPCYNNQLTSLDVRQNTALTHLNCYNNQLTSLDVSNNTELITLFCHSNQLTSLDVSVCASLNMLYCNDNQIYGENMAALVASLPIVEDGSGTFRVINLDSDTEQNVITTTQVATARGKNWDVKGRIDGTWQEYDGSEPPIEVTYIDENRNEQSALAVPLTSNETSLGVAGVERWYVARCTLNYTRTLTLRGDVHLILADGAVMNVGTEAEPIDEYGIVDSNTPASLTIFGQTLDDGTAGHLNVFSNDDCIYVSDDYAQHSGNVTLNSSNGSGLVSDNNITFTGGTLNATADKNAIANGGNVDILGGKLSAICVGRYWGINTIGDLTLGWKDADDEITVSGLVGSGGTASIVEGQVFTDGENTYDSTTPSEVLWALTNVTLRPVVPTFAINLPGETPHGTVSSDKTEAAEGETVTLTVTPDEGYALGTLTVLNGDSPVETTAGENGTYTFEMPAAPVTVTAVFVLPIDSINFPDANFRDWLLSQSYGSDRLLTDEEIAGITSISLVNKSISDLTGIEHFTALKTLNCNGNQLTALDVSQNTALTTLYCQSNQLTTLDVSGNNALEYLYCQSNQLTTLDVNVNTALEYLYCGNNQLTALDMSQNTALTTLYCDNNQLTALDLSDCTELTTLFCHSNQLTTLDVSDCTALRNLDCHTNQLTTLAVSQNTALMQLQCSDNQLTALDVSGCTALRTLNCYNNQLTALDVSDCTALRTLYCYENKIYGENMAALIASLPTEAGNGTFYVIDLDSDTEQNVITPTQVATARGKNWKVYGRTNGNWTAYDGSEPPIEVTYLDENREEQSVMAIPLTGYETSLGVAREESWYVASGTLNHTRTLTLSGDVHLILADGAVMNVGTEDEPINEYGIDGKAAECALTIYGQTLDDDTAGHLNIFSVDNCINLWGDYAQYSGNVTLNTSYSNGLFATQNVIFTGGTLSISAYKNALVNGGNVDILSGKLSAVSVGSYSGINTLLDLTLGWKDADDEITVSSLYSGGTASIVEGQAFTDGENIYYSTTPSEVLLALTNVTLRPVVPFAINLPSEFEHGTVECDKETADYGETVTLTVTPDEGYELESLIVAIGSDEPSGAPQLRRRGGELVELTPGDNGTYTFEMPAAPVTVNATFKETVITAVTDLTKTQPTGQRYNIMGQPVGKDYKGIVIEDGKKKVVK